MLKRIAQAALLLIAAPVLAQSTTVSTGDQVSFGGPDRYIVQPGDTLWEIAQAFLGDSYYWPRLWSINDYITNPHWIYPGNTIVFTMGDKIDGPTISLLDATPYQPETPSFDRSTDRACGPDVRFTGEWGGDVYAVPGFLAARRDIEVYGKVHRARTSSTNLAERDLLYLRLDDPESFTCGDVVTIFRPIKKKVRHPDSKRTRFGNLYRVVGEAKIVHHYGDYVSAVVRSSFSEITRGDLVGPSMPIYVEVNVRRPDGDLSGTIVERLSQESVLTPDRSVIFLDRGRADGIRPGNSFYVIEQQDENISSDKEDLNLPPSVIGRVVVLRVDEYSSTAVVTDANRSIEAGDRLTMEVD